ncbi:MAG: PqiC family protein [gamma proteobacterium symbiont of Bathyaustriella thionipta]|nr:PqiC family protein [gamma proteobacterium symbiont of Bathyaustriella thionipta]MCU7949168.1 PqiC family protein [gamma proteobacterium symbiont of Bathyaustriella thionipta]MCU7953352.1 PqiC family protein [gamma proteobacterium symbiont of Bathyaustriella thionipta]MCU7955736.1 PqiC family protein [gamma proteobacterium symbiont of Bathyaustriella thionipta]MCU7965645.1 PqiC family protein [gamma proteobacterium symbiont of Bathyaustriella thionipta]
MTLLKQYNMIFVLAAVLSGLLSISGCGTSQKTNFYQLEETSSESLIGVEKGSIIGVGPINLPEYINRPQIVTRNSAHHFNVSEFNRWIEPINDSISRLLVINLSNNLNSNQIYWVPRSDRQYPLDLRVVIDIGRFDGKMGKDVVLESRWSIFDKEDKPAMTKVSLIKEPVTGDTYVELVSAMNKALRL